MEGTFNFFTRDIWQADTWIALGKVGVIGAAYLPPSNPMMGDTNLQALDSIFGTDFQQTKDAIVDSVQKSVEHNLEHAKRGNRGEMGELEGQIIWGIFEAVAGSKGAGTVSKGASTAAKTAIGAERLARLAASSSAIMNRLKGGVLKVVKVGVGGSPNKPFHNKGPFNARKLDHPMNCSECVVNFEASARAGKRVRNKIEDGDKATSYKDHMQRLRDVGANPQFINKRFRDQKAIEAKLADIKPGQRFSIWADRKSGEVGHVFAGHKDGGGNLRFFETQTNSKLNWNGYEGFWIILH